GDSIVGAVWSIQVRGPDPRCAGGSIERPGDCQGQYRTLLSQPTSDRYGLHEGWDGEEADRGSSVCAVVLCGEVGWDCCDAGPDDGSRTRHGPQSRIRTS